MVFDVLIATAFALVLARVIVPSLSNIMEE
jgi:hypothetical protein